MTKSNEDLIAAMAKMWNEGNSASVLAKEFGKSRSAILGYVNRNKDLFHARPTGRPRGESSTSIRRTKEEIEKRRREKEIKNESKQTHPAAEVVDYSIPVDQRYPSFLETNEMFATKSLLELKDGDCKWPFGARNFIFCGRQATTNSCYCTYHNRKAYRLR